MEDYERDSKEKQTRVYAPDSERKIREKRLTGAWGAIIGCNGFGVIITARGDDTYNTEKNSQGTRKD